MARASGAVERSFAGFPIKSFLRSKPPMPTNLADRGTLPLVNQHVECRFRYLQVVASSSIVKICSVRPVLLIALPQFEERSSTRLDTSDQDRDGLSSQLTVPVNQWQPVAKFSQHERSADCLRFKPENFGSNQRDSTPDGTSQTEGRATFRW